MQVFVRTIKIRPAHEVPGGGCCRLLAGEQHLCVLNVRTPLHVLAGRGDQQEDFHDPLGRRVPPTQDLRKVLGAMFRTAELHVRPWHEDLVFVEADDLNVRVPERVRGNNDLAVVVTVLDGMADGQARAAAVAELVSTSPVQALKVVAGPVFGPSPPLIAVDSLDAPDLRLVFLDRPRRPHERIGDGERGTEEHQSGESDDVDAHGLFLQESAIRRTRTAVQAMW